jgi:hypothetical protein
LLLPLWLVVVRQQRQQQERMQEEQRVEEEDRTPYTERDLMEEWEFKIVRCTHPSFVRPEFLKALLDQEAEAGWQLVEVFDAQRVRLKRLTSQRTVDWSRPEGCDPYRLYVTDPDADAVHCRAVARGLWIVCGLCAVVGIGLGVVGAIMSQLGAYLGAGITLGIALFFGWLAWRRRRT